MHVLQRQQPSAAQHKTHCGCVGDLLLVELEDLFPHNLGDEEALRVLAQRVLQRQRRYALQSDPMRLKHDRLRECWPTLRSAIS